MYAPSKLMKLVPEIISSQLVELDNELTVLQCFPQLPVLSPVEQAWDVVEEDIYIMDMQ